MAALRLGFQDLKAIHVTTTSLVVLITSSAVINKDIFLFPFV